VRRVESSLFPWRDFYGPRVEISGSKRHYTVPHKNIAKITV
jgi:hypothetical protein